MSALPVRVLSFVAVLTALNLVSNYALISVPNVKFMDLFVFVGGYVLGVLPGVLVGFLTWLVYGTLNPYGFDPYTLAACCIGESFYGFAGGLSARVRLAILDKSFGRVDNMELWETNLKFGILGFILTFLYDLFTNVVTGMIFSSSLMLWIIQGIPFAVMHEVSNFLFFFFGCNILIVTVRKIALVGGEKT